MLLRRRLYATAILVVAATPVGILLWREPHDFPYSVIVGGICVMAVVVASLVLRSWRPVTLLIAATAVVITLVVVYDLVPEPRLTIEGTVSCANQARVVGVYINIDSGHDGFAEHTATSQPHVARYSYRLDKGSNFKIGVGCGGSPGNWKDSISSDYVPSEDHDFICYDGRDGEHPKVCLPVELRPAPQKADVGLPTSGPTLEIWNKVTNGANLMRDDAHPAYLSTVPRNFCKDADCAIPGTDVSTGDTVGPAVCQQNGARTTNGDESSTVDDNNPGLYSSEIWYGVRGPDDTIGYISDVWVRPSRRGGLTLPDCQSP